MDDETLSDHLEEYDEPIQELIKDLLETYFQGDEDIPVAAVGLRRRRVKREIDALKARKKRIEESINDLESELDLLDDTVDGLDEEVFSEALEKCSDIRADNRTSENILIQEQSDRVGLEEEDFIELLNEEWPTDRLGIPVHRIDNDVN